MSSHNAVLPDGDAAELARASAESLSRLISDLPKADRAHVSMDGHDVILPKQALVLLRDLLVEMAQGNAVTIVPTHAELTTQEAANVLNVSRPHFVKLLESGEIPFSKTGTHRRVLYQDVLSYRKARKQHSDAALDELVEQAQTNDMGY